MTKQRPTRELLNARRDLDDLPGVELLQDLEWYEYEETECWVLHCRLTPGLTPTRYLPATTDWYAAISPDYPWGEIRFYQAKEGGIDRTFHHQLYNGPRHPDLPWRSGDICRYSPMHTLNIPGIDPEPLDEWKRLSWHFERALEWLRDAARGELVLPGDPFELPVYPVSGPARLVFSEGKDTFVNWGATREHAGYAELYTSKTMDNYLFVKRFRCRDGQEIEIPTWGQYIMNTVGELQRAIWVLLSSVPVLEPWHPPSTWKELRETVRMQRLDLDHLLGTVANHIRDGKEHIALIGSPIPERVGENPSQIHWQGLRLPVLSKDVSVPHGFRQNEAGYWFMDRTTPMAGEREIDWLVSENWHVDQVSRRRGRA